MTMFNVIFRVSNDNEQFHDAPIDVVSSNIDQAVRKLDCFLFFFIKLEKQMFFL